MFRTIRRRLFPRAEMRRKFREVFGYELDLANARTFNEKIYREKLKADPRMTVAVDKVLVKKLVAEELGEDWVVPTIWHGSRLPSRSQRNWPIPYVIKANHGSGWNIFVRTKADENWPEIERKCARWLGSRYGDRNREKAYFLVPPQILVEPYLGDSATTPIDYRFFVFGGQAKFISADFTRDGHLEGLFYDRDWRKQSFERWPPRSDHDLPVPPNLLRMMAAAERLAGPYPFVRVDMYDVDGRPYFGEMTFFPGGGNIPFDPPEYDAVFGALWPD
jgi:hypothetical protein